MSSARIRPVLAILVALVTLGGCQSAKETFSAGAPASAPARAEAGKAAAKDDASSQANDAVSRARSDARKIIYKAELAVEVRSPSDAQAKLTSVVEREGGWVASAAREASNERASDVTLVLRVPAARFSAVLAEIRRLGEGKRSERIDSEDVTEEYVDLEARLRVQTRLEEQLLELLKTATTVEAALHVHKELASVRTEVERIQGRKQLLEREVAMSTIRLTLGAPAVENVSFSKIGQSVSLAYADSILVAGGIVVTAVRMTGILVPVAIMLGVPVLLAVLVVRRRRTRALPVGAESA